MRNPERIDRFLQLIGRLWHKFPDLRFGQLIYNAFRNTTEKEKTEFDSDKWFVSRFFEIEDDDLWKIIGRYYVPLIKEKIV